MTRHYLLHENIAALSAEIHTHELFDAFYDAHGSRLGGFTGIFGLCVAMGEALTAWERRNGGPEAYERLGIGWIELVEWFADELLRGAVAGALPDLDRLLDRLLIRQKCHIVRHSGGSCQVPPNDADSAG